MAQPLDQLRAGVEDRLHRLVDPKQHTPVVQPGEQLPPFAVPLALGSLNGDADTATHAFEGAAGRVPACNERGSQILNICELYEGAPVVLALFVDSGSCAAEPGA